MSALCFCAETFPSKERERVLDGKFHRWPIRVGNSWLLYGKKNTSFPYQAFVGPEWPCMIITNILIIVPTYFFIVNVAAKWHIAVAILACCSGIFLLCMFAATACSDPGIVFIEDDPESIELGDTSQGKSPEEKLELGGGAKVGTASKNGVQKIMCGQCGNDRPRTASHCYECGLCVNHLDHHCPWTGKCIAQKNLDRFHMFLWSLCIHVLFVVAMVVASLSNNTPVNGS
jgi:palmitoyltransferase ZDHHC9/14/18